MPDFDEAVSRLRAVYRRAVEGDPEVAPISQILLARDQVIPHYQRVFAPESIADLTEADFRSFLHFKNNKHWVSLQRLGPAICADMPRLRKALQILVDESRPIAERLNELVPGNGPAFVPRLGKAVLTPILLTWHPDRYGVWNKVSEASMKTLELWPELERGTPLGDRYEKVNRVVVEVARAVGVDLWTLDALWWRIEEFAGAGDGGGDPLTEVEADDGGQGSGAAFGLERHLQEFLRDNWNHTELGREWKLYEEDGDPEAGFEYPCGIGRIDLLAQHRSEPRWLVIELKRNQTSDQTIGQLSRYMGWVKERMARPGDRVEGLVIAREADESIRFALLAVPNVRIQIYEVDFRLREAR